MMTNRQCRGNAANDRQHLSRKSRQRWWQQSATAIPILISVFAVAIAGFAYFNQREATAVSINTYNANVVAAEMQYASLVSYYPDGSPYSTDYAVQNLSQRIMPEVVLEVTVNAMHNVLTSKIQSISPGPIYQIHVELGIDIGNLPACSRVIVNLTNSEILQSAVEIIEQRASPDQIDSKAMWEADPAFLSFVDPNDLNWVEVDGGSVRRTALLDVKHLVVLGAGPGAVTTTTSIPGCG